MSGSQLLDRLIKALQVQPSIGPRSACRIAYHLIGRKRAEAAALGKLLQEAAENIRECPVCRNFCDQELCALCADPKRAASGQLCVAESPSDVEALERSGEYKGRYFVLHGHLSPMDGIGLEELGIDRLSAILSSGSVKELIIATNPTVEGDATASLICSLAEEAGTEKITRPSRGVPLGGSIESTDQRTLISSFRNRSALR